VYPEGNKKAATVFSKKTNQETPHFLTPQICLTEVHWQPSMDAYRFFLTWIFFGGLTA